MLLPVGAVVSPKCAHHIERVLHDAAVKARRDGYLLPPEVTELLEDVRRLAALYRRQVSDASEVDLTEIGEVVPDRRMLTSEMVGKLAGISAHGVAEAARRKQIPAQLVNRRYEFDSTDVAAWLATHKETV